MSRDTRIGLAAIMLGLFGVAAFYLWPNAKWIGWICLVCMVVVLAYWVVLEICGGSGPRPKIVMGWVYSGKPVFGGLPVTLANVAFTNVGQESAHDVQIVPNKLEKYWIEQTAPLPLIKPDGIPVFPPLKAMYRGEDGQEHHLASQDDPARHILGVMVIDHAKAQLDIPVQYYRFGKKIKRHLTTYRMTISSGNPAFECIADK
jgi:hypothetical protein